MLQEKDIAIELKCQQYVSKTYMRNLEGTASVLMFESMQRTADVACPYCRGKVEICELANKHLRDIPVWQGISQELCFLCHRYRCTKCSRKHTEEIPLQNPGTRITERAATWIQTLLLNQMTIRGVQQITGIHWETSAGFMCSS